MRKKPAQTAWEKCQDFWHIPPLDRLDSWQTLSARATDVMLLVVLFVCPLFIGGASSLGMFVYCGAVGALAVTWLTNRSLTSAATWDWSGIEWLLLLGLGLVVLQLMPLSPTWLARLSPHTAELLPCWTGADGYPQVGNWNTISLSPQATRTGLGLFVAHGMLLLIIVQRLRTVEDVEGVVQWLALASLGMAAIGLLQYVSGTNRFLWVFDHPTQHANAAVSGPFISPNHFAHFLAVGVGPLLWWLQRQWQLFQSGSTAGPTGNSFGGKSGNQHASTASIIVGLALAVVVLAGILSRSRGGMVLTMLGGTLTTLLMIRMKALGKKSIAVLAGIGVVVLMGLWLHGTDAITEELETLTAGSLEQLDHTEGRRIIWSTNVRAAKAFPWLGTGIGSHRDMHHAFLDRAVPVEYSHAESVYLQVLSEAGIVGLVLFSLAIICVGWHLLRALRSQSHSQQLCAMALLSGLTVSLVSCIFDFAWYLPGCMTITIFLTGCAVQLGRLTTSEKMSRSARPLSRWAWGGAALFVGLVFVSIERHQLPYVRAASAWNRYLTLSLNASNEVDNRITNRDNLVSMAIQSESRDDKLLEELEEVVRVCPQHSRAHLRMASILLRNFARAQQLAPNPMDLSQIRDAAIASKFPSRPAQDAWLNAALGGNRQLIDEAYVHTTRSIATSPLQGRAYLYLADLVFLQGVGKEGTSQLLAQAHQLRPHDAAVLFILGREAALRGDTASALQYWKDSYHSSPEFRRGIVQTLAPQMPPQVFLEQFQPDTNMVRELYAFYRAAGLDEHAKLVVPDYAETFKEEALHASGSTATRLWQRAVDAYRFAGDAERTLECCARAAQASPTNVEAREDLARQLLDMDRLDESLKQYQWCLNKKPLDDKLRRRVREITKQIDVRRMQAIYQVDQGSYNNPTAQYPSAVLQR